ncbi:unnamed protein product [Triticum turgidum subsp. durum]|uniref:RNase H type-1 domain-containing protein n=1 Tax=Triticum turgidum subsp. durum TaxID=4567 RepID=A0A9R0R5F1_TRITD|nr:unnamed protein product [Triticum turgidum subsp. durum]
MLLRDHLANIIFSSCRQLFQCRDTLESELCAVMEGLSISIQRSDLPIHMEMDSLSAVNLVNGIGTDRSVYALLVAEIKHLMSLRRTCVTHIGRSQNVASDFLVKSARTEHRTVVWMDSGPPEVVDFCKEDCMMSHE